MKRQPDDLESRVANRRRQLTMEIIEHMKNSSRCGAVESISKIKRHLGELSEIVKGNEWTKLSAAARLRLAGWVER